MTISKLETTRYGNIFPITISRRRSAVIINWYSVPDSRSRAMVHAISVTVSNCKINPMIPGTT